MLSLSKSKKLRNAICHTPLRRGLRLSQMHPFCLNFSMFLPTPFEVIFYTNDMFEVC